MEKVQHSALEYSKITDTIYLGTNACCRSHFSKELIAKGVTADISLEEERLDAPFGVEFFFWLPTKDHTPPTVNQLTIGVQTLDFFTQHNIVCYVHCKNGHGRAPTLVAAYLMRSQGFDIEQAVDFIKQQRPTIHLEESQRAALEQFWNGENVQSKKF